MSELKLIVGEEAQSAEAPVTEAPKVNPMDALNRRDIELIKRSLASMHKDCAELRNTIVALHARQSSVPSRGFFLAGGALALVAVMGLSIVRPHLDGFPGSASALAKASTTDPSQ